MWCGNSSEVSRGQAVFSNTVQFMSVPAMIHRVWNGSITDRKKKKNIPGKWNKLMRLYKEAWWHWHQWEMRVIGCNFREILSDYRHKTTDTTLVFMQNSTFSACVSSKNKRVNAESILLDICNNWNVFFYYSKQLCSKCRIWILTGKTNSGVSGPNSALLYLRKKISFTRTQNKAVKNTSIKPLL